MQIAFTGDIMLGRLVNSVLCKNKFTYVWGDTLDIIRSADLSLINLECVISSLGKKWNKTFKIFHFRAHLEAIDVLKVASIDYVSLANNHVLDYDVEAMVDMLDLLDKNGIKHSGAGRNLKEAMEPAILKIKKESKNTNSDRVITIGIISLTDNKQEWEATDNYPGVNYIPTITLSKEKNNENKKDKKELNNDNKKYYYDYDRLEYYITKAKQISDLVIVSSHVGSHFRESPSSDYVNFAHMIIDMGADIYWGHSNHMPQGIEIYKENRIIMYDCGDFIDDYGVDLIHRNDLSFIFLLNFEDSNNNDDSNRLIMKDIELIPIKISDFRANSVLTKDEVDVVIGRMIKRCNYLGTDNCLVINKETNGKRIIKVMLT